MKLVGLSAIMRVNAVPQLTKKQGDEIRELEDVVSLGLTHIWYVVMKKRNEATEKRLDEIFGDTNYGILPEGHPEW